MNPFFQVTAEYSNAVLLAILPHINDAAKSLDLSVTRPVMPSHVLEFRCDPRERHFGGVVFLKNGTFWFDDGHVTGFESSHSYYALQEPNEIPRFYGTPRMTKQEAVQMARQAISKLGYDSPRIKSEEPQIAPLQKIGTNVIPHYDITWLHTLGGVSDVTFARVEVNAERKQIEKFFLPAREFIRPPPQIAIARPATPKRQNSSHGGTPLEPVSAERQSEILKTILPEISAYAQRLKLPVPADIKTNDLKDIQGGLINGLPNFQVILSNDYRFNYGQDKAISFYGPDCYFVPDWKQRGKTEQDFMGPLPPRLEPLEELARNALKATKRFKDTRFLNERPVLAAGPDMMNKVDITHFLFYWHPPGLTEKQKVEIPDILWPTAAVEVDSKTMTVQSIGILDPKQ